MTTRKHHTKMIHEGDYVAEVDVELIETDSDWSPYLKPEDAYKLDDVRLALREGNIKKASKQAHATALAWHAAFL